MSVSLTIFTMLASLVIAGAAIVRLARRTGHGVVLQWSGFAAAALGLWVLFYGRELLPFSPTRYDEGLAFGVAYCGQALIFMWLAMKAWPKLPKLVEMEN